MIAVILALALGIFLNMSTYGDHGRVDQILHGQAF